MKTTIIYIIGILLMSQSFATTLDEVLQKNVHSMGGFAAIDAVETIYTVGEVSGIGVIGTDVAKSMKPNMFAEDIDFGIIRQVTVTDGMDCWFADQNGQLRKMSGGDRDLMEISAYFANMQYMEPKPRTATLSGEDDDNYIVTYNVVEALPVQVYFDKSSGLINRLEISTDFGLSTTYYKDYREVDGGILMPFFVRQWTDPQEIISKLTDVRINSGVSVDDFVPNAPEPNDALIESQTENTPIELYDNLVVVEVSVDGRPGNFLVDSGASMSVLNANDDIEHSGAEIASMGVGGSEFAMLIEADYLAVGGAKILSPTIAVLRLGAIGDAIGTDIDGILGYDFLSRFIVKVDYDNREMSIYNRDDFIAPDGLQFIPVEFVANLPVIEMEFEGTKEKFILDMGNNESVILHSHYVRDHKLLEKYTDKTLLLLGGVGGKTRAFSTKAGLIKLGGYEIKEPIIALSTAEDAAFAMTSVAGNVGGGILSNFTLYLDYSGNRLGLEPVEGFTSGP